VRKPIPEASVLRKHTQLIVIGLAAVLVLFLAYEALTVALPFALGILLAYILHPAVSWAERNIFRTRWIVAKRSFAIAGGYLIFLSVFGGTAWYVGNTTYTSFMTLVNDAPQKTQEAITNFTQLPVVQKVLPAQWLQELSGDADDNGDILGGVVQDIMNQGASVIPQNMALIMALVSLPLFLFYVLKDWDKITRSFDLMLPSSANKHCKKILEIIGSVLGRYMRAQIIMGCINASLTFLGLLVIGAPFAGVIAIVAGIGEVIPEVGFWIAAATAVVITLSLDPEKIFAVMALFVCVKMVVNFFIVPRVQSSNLNIHPAVVIVLLVIGPVLWGFWGLVFTVPLAAIVIRIFQYVNSLADTTTDSAVQEQNKQESQVMPQNWRPKVTSAR
jgi:predicted PurR-regulated permease PerM